MSENEALLNVQEFAAALHSTVTPRTILTLIHQGKIRAMKLGKRYYMTREELTRFISPCPDNENQPASSSAKMTKHGSSSMEGSKSGQASVMDFVTRQKKL